ncbi:MAG: serine hydrolase [Planctomycetota bacterium]
MRSHSVLAGVLAAALFHSAATAQVVAYHDADSAAHQGQFNTLSGTGYRMISLSVYGTPGNLQYAAVWVHRAGPNYIGFHDLTSAEYGDLVNTWANSHVPTLVTACGAGANARFAGVLEASNHPVWARHGLTTQDLNDEMQLVDDAGWRIRTVDVYGTAGDPRYVVSFEPHDDNLGWGFYFANGVSGHQTLFDAMREGYCRPVHVAFNDDSSRFLAMWHDTSVGNWIAEHDLTSAEYQQRTTDYANQFGYYPIDVQGSGSGSGRRFAAVWAATDRPIARQWSTSGQVVPQLASFDSWVQTWMQSTGTRGASLAVVKDGKLKLARGYTWAEPGYPQTLPTSRFRIASCVKPLTSIAIHQEIAQAPGAIDYGRLMVDYFNNPVVADNQTNAITIRDLLTHQGGWDRSVTTGSGIDPMFFDVQIANAGNLDLPIDTTDIRLWMQGQSLDFAPGTQYRYSNYGFSLLGRILERRNPGKTYDEVMQAQVFGPLGITRAVIGGALKGDILPDEVRYHPQRMSVARSVNSEAQPWVPNRYGGWNNANLDAHGAYIMATPDFAKVLASFDLQFNPILPAAQATDMWTPNTATSNWLKGWFLEEATDIGGNTLRMFDHNGVLPGTRTYIARREDGISFVFFTNGDVTIGGDQGRQLSDLANAVTAWPPHDLFGSVGVPPFHHVDDILMPSGSGCPGTAGLPRLSGSGSAEIGGRASFDLASVPPGAPALCVLGMVPAAIDLGVVGAPGCVLHTDPVLSWFLLAGTSGTASQPLDIPAEPALVGVHFYVQFGAGDPRANPAGLVASNGLDVLIGGWQGQ